MLPPWPVALRHYFGRLPTTDLYLLNPLAELQRQGAHVPQPRYLAPNVYLVGSVGVIVRYGHARDVDRLRRAGAKRIVYVVDDDFRAGAADPNLPERYRLRLKAFVESDWPILTKAADILIVPGVVLANQYGENAHIVPPAWNFPCPSTDHFSAKTIEIVHLGTASHLRDLDLIVEPLTNVLEAHPRTRLTLFAGEAVPGRLRSHSHVRLCHPHSWWRYRRALPRLRFHVALYPLAPGPFNEARSANKLFEHALVGAASLMSPNPALRAAAGPEAAATFVEGGAKEWEAKLADLVAAPQTMRLRFERARAHIQATNPLAYAALQWRDILSSEM